MGTLDMTPEFIYKLRVKQFIREVEQLKKEKDYDEFVMKSENRIALWNRILNKPTQIGIVSSTF